MYVCMYVCMLFIHKCIHACILHFRLRSRHYHFLFETLAYRGGTLHRMPWKHETHHVKPGIRGFDSYICVALIKRCEGFDRLSASTKDRKKFRFMSTCIWIGINGSSL